VAVRTSGGYERYFVGEDGNTYHHIIDPNTGISADSGIVSATIVSKSGTLADGLSTACFVMGVDRAAEYWRTRSQDFDMVLVTESGEMYITAGLEGKVETSCAVYVIE
jgi:thiamine biosynthesis lipoprotein